MLSEVEAWARAEAGGDVFDALGGFLARLSRSAFHRRQFLHHAGGQKEDQLTDEVHQKGQPHTALPRHTVRKVTGPQVQPAPQHDIGQHALRRLHGP